MIVDAYYNCRAEIAEPDGRTRLVRESIPCAVPRQSVTDYDEAGRAAWSLWRELVPYHRCLHVIVTGADVKVNGRWHREDLAQPYHYTAEQLRALSPKGSPYATQA